jgi:hypothetical protein
VPRGPSSFFDIAVVVKNKLLIALPPVKLLKFRTNVVLTSKEGIRHIPKDSKKVRRCHEDANLSSQQFDRRREGKYLTFSLDLREYGIRILKVMEIIGMMRVTPVPQTPQYVKGVINLPGFGSCLNWNCIPDMAKIRDGMKILSGTDCALKMDGIGVVERVF